MEAKSLSLHADSVVVLPGLGVRRYILIDNHGGVGSIHKLKSQWPTKQVGSGGGRIAIQLLQDGFVRTRKTAHEEIELKRLGAE